MFLKLMKLKKKFHLLRNAGDSRPYSAHSYTCKIKSLVQYLFFQARFLLKTIPPGLLMDVPKYNCKVEVNSQKYSS
jgi:hypothetical protein